MMRTWAFVLPALLMVLPWRQLSLAAVACPGDCDGDGVVRTHELVRCVEIALGAMPPIQCPTADSSGDHGLTINEIVLAVEAAIDGCPTPTPTSSPTASATAVPTATSPPTATRTPTDTPTPTQTPTPMMNRAPVVAGPIYKTYPGYPIAWSLSVSDPDGNGVSCMANALPDGASFDDLTGVISWTPRDDQLGPFYADLTCADDGNPPQSADGRLAIQVNPIDGCSAPQCDPATGCVSPLPSVGAPCCADGPAMHVPQATADCPGGRVLFAGRNDDVDHNGMGRLQNCDRFRVLHNAQSSATVRFHVETRCVDLSGPAPPSATVILRARMETSSRVLFSRDRTITIKLEPDGYARAYSLSFSVGGPRPYFDLTDAEANFTLSLFDSSGNFLVSNTVRVILGFNQLPDIPPVE